MELERRIFLKSVVPAALLIQMAGGGQGPPQSQKEPWPPVEPEEPPGEAPRIDNKQVLKHNQSEIQQDVERLFSLAQQLKNQVEKTNSADVLSLPLLQKAEEIEKLARKIRNLARG